VETTHAYELFHEIADPPCATARRFVTNNLPEGLVRFRNVIYEEVAADHRAHGGTIVPALWNGKELVSGFEAVMAVLQQLQVPKNEG
jgi:hypothetical protein